MGFGQKKYLRLKRAIDILKFKNIFCLETGSHTVVEVILELTM